MAMHTNTEDNIHSYAYSVQDMGRAIALVLEYAHQHPDIIAEIRAFKDRGEAIAATFDDAHDSAEPWDVGDVAHGLIRTIL